LSIGCLCSAQTCGVTIDEADGPLQGIALESELTGGLEHSRRYFIGDSYARLFPPRRNEHRRFVISMRDADKPINAFLLQPFAYRLLQYTPVGAVKYLHFHH